ncbi:PREDICTED: Meckel syndrome type 1 protein-like isoform X1 [Amphimedon queenslandica]|uniref:Meckel syndrome type 1 protein n=1 Tax=Amphimedon queenslandica TaxID=400682 RepID=A0AAN0JB60_AMPQE|nr:PREDICTED: Meckel syndrome type 1 protein-like isoform X1 [Amphimedon queenslandica]|eukprot:XP_019853981.1 PREDICTED: Meckel syndrome type 1 protein-like isoform X1 [Amphimedon queenslandica]
MVSVYYSDTQGTTKLLGYFRILIRIGVMYRLKDPLENLKLKVSLRKASLSRRRLELASNPRESNENADLEVLTFHWQEKYFSPLEKRKYAEEPPSNEDYQILLAKKDRNANSRLFSYISQDRYQPYDDEPVIKKGRRKNAAHHRQTMYVMADLQSQIDGLDFDEKVLFTITVDTTVGQLMLSRDVSHDEHWYRIESSGREIFEYRIENVSQPITGEELQRERQLHNQLHSHQSERLKQSLGAEFQSLPPDKDTKLVHIIGSIETAEGFGWSPVYIIFQLHLPNEGFELKSGIELISTQLSSPNSDQVTHFCTPFEYELLVSTPSPSSGSSPSMSSPFVSVEVSSLDFWDRHRLEGYGTYSLPLVPASLTVPINTSKPSPTSLKEQLLHYFIGTSSRTSLKDSRDAKSRFGATSISSGKVYIKLSVLSLSRETAEIYSSKEMREKLRQQQGNLSMSVKAVTDAYHKARSKALEVLKTSEDQSS